MALQLLTPPSGPRSNVENKFHMLKYAAHYPGTGIWTFFFHFSTAFNTMGPALLGEKPTVRPQYMHTFKAVCQTGPGWVALGPHRGRVHSPFLLTLHCGLQSSPMTLPMSDGITRGNYTWELWKQDCLQKKKKTPKLSTGRERAIFVFWGVRSPQHSASVGACTRPSDTMSMRVDDTIIQLCQNEKCAPFSRWKISIEFVSAKYTEWNLKYDKNEPSQTILVGRSLTIQSDN